MNVYYIVSNGIIYHIIGSTDKCRAIVEAMILLKCSFSHASEVVLDNDEYIASFDWEDELDLVSKQEDMV